jgi:hypothetical protein
LTLFLSDIHKLFKLSIATPLISSD